MECYNWVLLYQIIATKKGYVKNLPNPKIEGAANLWNSSIFFSMKFFTKFLIYHKVKLKAVDNVKNLLKNFTKKNLALFDNLWPL